MSEIILNRHGIDQVGFEITTEGDSVASCTLNSILLNPSLDYILRVQELNAPISSIPLLGFETTGQTLNKELFRVKHREAGTTFVNFQLTFETDFFGLPAPFNSRFMSRGPGGQVHYNATGFITTLAKHANNFTKLQDVMGAGNPVPAQGIGSPGSQTEYLRIRLNADGCVEIIGTSIFWNNFCLQFSDYGKAILGITTDEHNVLAITTKVNNGGVVFTMFDHDIPGAAPGAPLIYNAPNNNVIDLVGHAHFTPMVETSKVVGTIPIFKNLEARYFVSVETDLLVSQAIKVIDGKQTIDRSICKVYFPTTCRVLLQSEDGILREDVDFEITTHVGQYSFIRKTRPSKQWTALQTSYDLRFYRFHLYITYRYFDASGKWIMSRMKYPMGKEDSWTLSLEFVSKL